MPGQPDPALRLDSGCKTPDFAAAENRLRFEFLSATIPGQWTRPASWQAWACRPAPRCTGRLDLDQQMTSSGTATSCSLVSSMSIAAGDSASPAEAKLSSGYSPSCCLIFSSISLFTASKLNEAGACIGGNSMAVCASSATSCCTMTKRQNSRA
jgi:hypothetical protein